MKTLVKKLCLIMSEVGSIEKKGTNTFHKYNYIKEEDVTAKLRELLSKHNVFVFCSILDSKKDGPLTEVVCEYTFCCGETGESFKAQFRGHGYDNQDKGIYKAMTGCHKYFLLKNFNLSAGDDPEDDSKDDAKTDWNAQISSNKMTAEITKKSNLHPSTFEVPFGKNKGILVSTLSKDTAERSLKWCTNTAKPPYSQSIIDYTEVLKMHLASFGEQASLDQNQTNYQTEDIPF